MVLNLKYKKEKKIAISMGLKSKLIKNDEK